MLDIILILATIVGFYLLDRYAVACERL